MNLGELLLYAALVTGALGLGLRAPALRDPGSARWRRLERWGAAATYAHAGILIVALALLVGHFLLGILTVEYVWEHTDVHYPWYYKLSGLWGGQKGTILLWAGLLALFLIMEGRRAGRADEPKELRQPRRWVVFLLAALTVGFTGYMVADGVFEPTPGHLLEFPATRDGRGLQESLVTPLMVIHPPLQFIAYALIALPAAWALAGWAAPPPGGWGDRARRAWVTPALRWALPAWLFATIGLGLGGLWAYYVLNFGGYWAWDPVETANLLPWLALTAFIHAGRHLERYGDFPLAAPALAFLGAWLVFFATFATRSGLWVSVHAFTDPTNKFNPDAAARLLSIMDVSLPTRFTGALLVGTGLLASALLVEAAARHVRAPPAGRRVATAYAGMLLAMAGLGAAAPSAFFGLSFEAGARVPFLESAGYGAGLLWALLVGVPVLLLYLLEDAPAAASSSGTGWRAWLGTRRLVAAGVTLFTIGLAVAMLLDFQVVNGFDRTVFDVRAPFVAVPLVSVLTLYLAKDALGPRAAVALAGGGLLAGALSALIWQDEVILAVSAPVLVAALAAGVVKILHVNRGGDATPRLRVAGGLLLVASLLGLVMWSNPPTHQPIGPFVLNVGPGLGAAFWGLSFVGFLGAVSALRASSLPLAMAGAGGATLAAGYGVGAPLALAALVLLILEARAFPERLGGLAFLRREAPRLAQTGIWLIHLAVIIGLLGYAASTYAQDRAAFRLAPGEVDTLDEWTFEISDSTGEAAPIGGWYTNVAAILDVGKNGEPAARGTLEFYYRDPPIAHYDPRLDIQRGFTRDLYLSPLTIKTVGQPAIQAHGETCAPTGTGACFRSAVVEEVTFEVTILPLITLVWAGLWLMGAGMLMVLGGTAAASRSKHRATATQGASGGAKDRKTERPAVKAKG